MRVFGLTAFAKQRVGFIKEENPPLMLRLVKDLARFFSGLADIFGDGVYSKATDNLIYNWLRVLDTAEAAIDRV